MKHFKNEKELIEACIAGDEQAMKILYQLHKDTMMGLCMRYSKTREEAQDILQEGFIKVFRDIHQYQPVKSVVYWIRKVMVNTALEHIRKYKKLNDSSSDLLPEDLHLIDYASKATDFFDAAYLLDMVQQLPIEYQVVFNMFGVEGYSHKEIAEKLGISVSLSKVRYLRARTLLKEELKKKESEKKVG